MVKSGHFSLLFAFCLLDGLVYANTLPLPYDSLASVASCVGHCQKSFASKNIVTWFSLIHYFTDVFKELLTDLSNLCW